MIGNLGCANYRLCALICRSLKNYRIINEHDSNINKAPRPQIQEVLRVAYQSTF